MKNLKNDLLNRRSRCPPALSAQLGVMQKTVVPFLLECATRRKVAGKTL